MKKKKNLPPWFTLICKNSNWSLRQYINMLRKILNHLPLATSPVEFSDNQTRNNNNDRHHNLAAAME